MKNVSKKKKFKLIYREYNTRSISKTSTNNITFLSHICPLSIIVQSREKSGEIMEGKIYIAMNILAIGRASG